ncbi:MAG: hypothetical protein ACRBCS_09555 [Cellvibrionaceae bacterium]
MTPKNANQNKSPYDQYLNQYAEVESSTISNIPQDISGKITTKYALIIPAFKESCAFLTRLKEHPIHDCFFIVVINSPDNQNSHDEDNKNLYDFSQHSGKRIWSSENINLIRWTNNNYLILVDRFSNHQKIPRKQGVGLARKIACDIAISLIKNKILTTHFIHSSDADATLPIDYFSQTNNIKKLNNVSAAIYQFSHSKEENAVGEASNIYEKTMRYYVDGLRYANSHFAFHTIGSCLAISAKHYCQARGFPKKSGGEDFYLLNKLAKLGEIKTLEGDPIQINSRESDRVPFGTGPAVSKIIISQKKFEYPAYNPKIFVELKELLHQFKTLTDCISEEKNHIDATNQYQIKRCKKWLSSLNSITTKALYSMKIDSLFNHLINNCKNQQQIQEHLIYWFDGFKTLKYIHFLQQHQYPTMPLHLALKESKALGF